jgi:hypothetical protein
MKAQDITIGTKAHNLTHSHLSKVGTVTECLAAGEVGKMDFDCRNIDGGDGITERCTGVGIRPRVDDQRIDSSHRPLNGIDKPSFMV